LTVPLCPQPTYAARFEQPGKRSDKVNQQQQEALHGDPEQGVTALLGKTHKHLNFMAD
jgi:hypothetical protein